MRYLMSFENAALTLSMTLICLKRRMFWKVLAMPASTNWYVFLPLSTWPFSSTLPSVGAYTPVSRLKTVVLPAPLGPMSPASSPE